MVCTGLCDTRSTEWGVSIWSTFFTLNWMGSVYLKHSFTFNWMGSVCLKHSFRAQLNGECLPEALFSRSTEWGVSIWSTLLIQITSFYTGCSTNVTDSCDSETDGVVLQRWHTPTMKITSITSTITHIDTSMMRNEVGGVWVTVLNKASGFTARNCWIKSILDHWDVW